MIKYTVVKNAKILFIGINPHHGSFRRGVPFSNNKTFWYLLNQSGLIKERKEDLKDDKKLKEIYKNRFSRVYKLALLNVVNRPSRTASELNVGEEIGGRKKILTAIKRYKPKVVCFVGKVTFQKFSGEKKVNFGWQNDIYRSKIFVMHFPIRGEAAIRVKELKLISHAKEICSDYCK
jgi:TDG/mug DNA glycosylase family protein